jgi:methanogenic corrinoid protein MtbC1
MQKRNGGGSSIDFERYFCARGRLQNPISKQPSFSVETSAREVIQRRQDQGENTSIDNPSRLQIELLCRALIAEDEQAAAQFIDNIRVAGASAECTYLRYLADAARMLGEWWDRDLISFAQVAVGTSRMYAIMRSMRFAFDTGQMERRSATFVSVPGETHTLGIQMAADIFRKDGWKIDLKIGMSHEDLVSQIGQTNASLIGLSAAGTRSLDALSKLIAVLRISNPRAEIFVGGHIVKVARRALEALDIDGMASEIGAAKDVLVNIQNKKLLADLAKLKELSTFQKVL